MMWQEQLSIVLLCVTMLDNEVLTPITDKERDGSPGGEDLQKCNNKVVEKGIERD